jgi:hypothetical protein
MTSAGRQAGPAIGTIVARNFMPFARVLAGSLREHHPELPMFVVLADGAVRGRDPDQDGDPARRSEPFELVPLEALGIPDLRQLCFGYTRQQLAVCVKPHLLGYLLERGYAAALFLDADILVLDRLDPLIDAVTSHAIALTPHLLGQLHGADRITRELNILQSGIYNGGFIGVSARAEATRFLRWFADRLHTHCRHSVADGMHFDQRWLDLVPACFDDVTVVRARGCNVAHWNLPERDLRWVDGRAMAGDEPCRFFHFSGFEPAAPGVLTRYSARLAMADLGAAASLFTRYVRLLEEHGLTGDDPPYAYDTFDNGVPIPAIARQIYLDLGEDAAQFGDPFCTAPDNSFFHWLRQPAAVDDVGRETGPVSRLWDAVHRSRRDLRQAYPDPHGADREAYLAWTVSSGLAEHGIPDVFRA